MKIKLKKCDGCQKDKPIWKNVIEGEERKRYCQSCYKSKSCQNDTNNGKPTNNRQKPIRPRSSKREKEDVLYSILRKQFLKNHPFCQMNLKDCTNTATEVHHKKGRGKYYLDDTTFMAGCHNCHSWVTDHPAEAIKLGLSELRLT